MISTRIAKTLQTLQLINNNHQRSSSCNLSNDFTLGPPAHNVSSTSPSPVPNVDALPEPVSTISRSSTDSSRSNTPSTVMFSSSTYSKQQNSIGSIKFFVINEAQKEENPDKNKSKSPSTSDTNNPEGKAVTPKI